MPSQIRTTRMSSRKAPSSLMQMNVSFGRISHTTKVLFVKHISIMLRSGLTIGEALQISAESAYGSFQRVLQGVIRSVDAGRPFSEALARYPRVFSELFVSAVEAGERSGTLVENLQHIGTELEKEKKLTDNIRSALMYPVIVLVATFILGMGIALIVLPKITPLFLGLRVQLPASTRALIWFSNLVQGHGLVLFIGTIGIVIVFFWLIRQKFMDPVVDWLALRIPLLKNLVHQANVSRFCRTLGTLLKSGLTISEALEVTESNLQNYYYRRAVHHTRERVNKGVRLSENLENYPALFTLTVTRMVRVGEESGNLSETLVYLSDFYESEIETATKSFSAALEPLLLLFVGLVVGFLAISIITPIYEITGNIQR